MYFANVVQKEAKKAISYTSFVVVLYKKIGRGSGIIFWRLRRKKNYNTGMQILLKIPLLSKWWRNVLEGRTIIYFWKSSARKPTTSLNLLLCLFWQQNESSAGNFGHWAKKNVVVCCWQDIFLLRWARSPYLLTVLYF